MHALKTLLAQFKQGRAKALFAQLQQQFKQRLAQKRVALDAARAQIPVSEPAPTEPPPDSDAGVTPAVEPSVTPEGQFWQRCLDAVQAYFNGAPVNQTSGGVVSPQLWIHGYPYWF